MQNWLVDLRLPSYNRLWGALVLSCTLLACLSILLFGTLPGLILCATFGLVYSVACFICYHPEAQDWRDKLDGYYQSLFIHVLGYVHSSFSTNKPERKLNGGPSLSTVKGSPDTKDNNEEGSFEQSQVQPSKACHREAQKMIQLIMQDFIHSWYGTVTDDLEFPDDVQKLLEHVALETNIRMQRINLEEIVSEIAAVVIPYLEVVNESGMRTYNNIEVFDVNSEKCLRAFESNDVVTHRALNSRELEQKYYRQALDALIQCAFPDKYEGCDLACTFVREVLLKNIIEPLFDLLCDPDFLLAAIPLILKKASPEKVQRELLQIREENEELERKLTHGRLILKIKGSPVSHRRRFQTQSGRFFGSDHHSATPAPEVQQPAPLPTLRRQKTTPAASKRTTWGTFSSRSFETPLAQSSLAYDSNQPQLGVEPEAFVASSYSLPNGASPPKNRAFSTHSTTLTPSWGGKEMDGRRHSEGDDSTWDMIEYEYEGEEMPQRAPIFCDRHVFVITSSGSRHTAYIFKFPKRFLSEDELERVGVSDVDTHLEGMKRYSEFDKLHSALLKSSMSAHVKGFSLPSKINLSKFVSKFSLLNRDPDPVEINERLLGLEKYLQAISAVTTIADSELFHRFLISGIESLKSSDIVQPQAKFVAKKKPIWSRRFKKGPSLPTFKEPTQKAEKIPDRLVETVLSAYLDTHLPLPSHSLHTLHSIKTNSCKPATTKSPPPRQDRSNTLVYEPPSVPDSPAHSVISTASLETRGIPLADLAATPKATDHIHMAAHRYGRSAHGVALVGGGPSDMDTDQSSLSRSPALSVEDEENQTVGSTASLSSSSYVSVSDELKPSIVARPQVIKVAEPPPKDIPQKQPASSPSQGHTLRDQLWRLWQLVVFYVSLLYNMVVKGLQPVRVDTSAGLATEHSRKVPLSNSLFALGSEASQRHCFELWACHENTQLALLVLVGGGMERYMWKELKELVYSEENWSRALYHLRHTLWPGGKFMSGSRQKPSEEQKMVLRKEAVAAIKQFLPNFLPVIVGAGDYDNAVNHVLDCLQNPKVTRYFVLRLIDLMLTKLVPELGDEEFQRRLARLRTMTPPPRNGFNTRST